MAFAAPGVKPDCQPGSIMPFASVSSGTDQQSFSQHSAFSHQSTDHLQNMDDESLHNDMISSLGPDSRRQSYASSPPTLFQPEGASWDDCTPANMDRKHNMSHGPIYVTNNNPFTRMEQPQIATYGHQHTWPMAGQAADLHPPFERPAHDVYAGDYEAVNAFMAPSSSTAPVTANRQVPVLSNLQPSTIFHSSSELDTPVQSPSAEKWMPDESDVRQKPEHRFPRKMSHHHHQAHSPGTPSFIHANGVRKKNARFDIPHERNLSTIDSMIAAAMDEELVKELKAQKRLLRNRQAALDSRQRKKKHTEELEREKEEWRDNLTKLEAEVRTLRGQAEQHYHERMQWEEGMFGAQQQIESLVCDKEELVAQHTRETGELRKRISMLSSQLQATPLSASTVSPSSASDYHDFAAEMNGLTMNPDAWRSYVADEQVAEQGTVPHNGQLTLASTNTTHQGIAHGDNPLATGVMYTILLLGAWMIASKSGDKMLPVPDVPGNVKAASTAVINDVFSEASSAQGVLKALGANRVGHIEPGQSNLPGVMSWPLGYKSTMSGTDLHSMSGPGLGIGQGRLDQMHHSLTSPTFDQQAEQLFGLSPTQYEALTSTDFTRTDFTMPLHTPPMTDEAAETPPMTSGRKNLAQSLRKMREQAASGSTADVYTRSLLWDKIPVDVVKEFKRMVLASENAKADHDAKDG